MVKGKGRQPRPEGGLTTPTDDQRALVRKLREGRGWRQEDLATKAGCTHGTISNLETGRHPQIKRVVLARVMRVLRSENGESNPTLDKLREFLAGEIDKLDELGLEAVRAVVVAVKPKE